MSTDYGVEYKLTDTEGTAEIIPNNTGINENGFEAVTSSGVQIRFPSFSQPAAACRLASTKAYDIYYTSEIYNTVRNTLMNRRLYFVASGKIDKYVQLEPTQIFLPQRFFRIMGDGTVYQMITSQDSLSIVKMGFSTDYPAKPSYMTTPEAE